MSRWKPESNRPARAPLDPRRRAPGRSPGCSRHRSCRNPFRAVEHPRMRTRIFRNHRGQLHTVSCSPPIKRLSSRSAYPLDRINCTGVAEQVIGPKARQAGMTFRATSRKLPDQSRSPDFTTVYSDACCWQFSKHHHAICKLCKFFERSVNAFLQNQNSLEEFWLVCIEYSNLRVVVALVHCGHERISEQPLSGGVT